MEPRKLIDRTEKLFAGVTLADGGISLREADAFDRYEHKASRAKARALDEHHRWQKLVGTKLLNEGFAGAMCFADARALRFYLPACLATLLALDNPDDLPDLFRGLLFHVSQPRSETLFSMLTQPQLLLLHDALLVFQERTGDDRLLAGDISNAIETCLLYTSPSPRD